MKKISKLQFITADPQEAELACKAGVDWIQMRVKSSDKQLLLQKGRAFEKICQQYSAQLIINDHVWLYHEIQAAGVHVGKQDMGIAEVRNLIGANAIIGGTSNAEEDVQNLMDQKADYIGLGPFRFTSTKEKLSPILGLSGIVDILQALDPKVPIIAIGGLQPEDTSGLVRSGCYGVAVSGAIANASDKTQKVEEFKRGLEV